MTKKAVIFDLDGTLVNSIPVHYKVHRDVFKKFGINLTPHFFQVHCNGTEAHEAYRYVLNHFLGSDELYEKAWQTHNKLRTSVDLSKIKIFPGVKRMLKQLKEENYKLAVASSSHETYVRALLENNGITDFFDFITGSDHVKHSKPNPAIFLNAWKGLGIPKKNCIIIEDTNNGVIAAKRAGIECLCLLTSEKEDDIPRYAHIVDKHSMLFNIIDSL
jgi:HAD superfamily hydrolase (TIGR01509 family)